MDRKKIMEDFGKSKALDDKSKAPGGTSPPASTSLIPKPMQEKVRQALASLLELGLKTPDNQHPGEGGLLIRQGYT
jgi:hypothetical protein